MECPHFTAARCQSCRWLASDYPSQLARKQAQLRALLADLSVEEWCAPVGSPESGFRNKAKMVVLGAAHAPLLGIMSPSGEPVSLTDCALYPNDMQPLLQRLQHWVQQAGLPPYRVDKAKGELKFILLTRSMHTGEYLLRFVLRSEQAIPRIRAALPLLLADYPQIRVISVNIQPVHMAVLEGEQEIFLTDSTRIEENFNGVPLYIRPKSFFQTNPSVAAKLYQTARDWSRTLAPRHIWDLFCGVGGFGLHCADAETRLTGIEIEAEAIACAQLSATALGLTRVSFAALDADHFASKHSTHAAHHSAAPLAPSLTHTPDLVIVNPPRRGLGATLSQQLNRFAPPAILYSSCNPQTLRQDIAALSAYRLKQVQLFDMFPHTAHYEVLALLQRH